MKMGRFPAVLAIVAGAIGCGTDALAPEGKTDGPRRVADWLEESDSAHIGLGETVTVGGVAVSYLALEGDSRCPIGVTCVWEGDAEVRLHLAAAGAEAEVVLHTALDPRSSVIDGLELKLLDVLPYPLYDTSTDPSETEVVVRVRGVSGS